MTRLESTGIRELNMSGWVRCNLPDSSTGLLVTDLDFIIFNYKKRRLMLLEVKTRNSKMKTWQSIIFSQLEKWIKKGIDQDWDFRGFHVVTFENTLFHDGKCYLDGKESTESEIRQFLGLEK